MHRTALVNASRLVLTMLLIAAVALLGLAIAIHVLGDPPEVEGWLRTAFGKVFGVVAVSLAAVLGIPAAVGLWAMAGSTAEDAAPALPLQARRILVGVAIVTVVATAVVLIVTGSVTHSAEPRAARTGRSRLARPRRRDRVLAAPQPCRGVGRRARADRPRDRLVAQRRVHRDARLSFAGAPIRRRPEA